MASLLTPGNELAAGGGTGWIEDGWAGTAESDLQLALMKLTSKSATANQQMYRMPTTILHAHWSYAAQ